MTAAPSLPSCGPRAWRLLALLVLLFHPGKAGWGAERPPAGGPGDLTVMSYNLRHAGGDTGGLAWEARRAAVADRIRAAGADLVATQECLAVQADDLRRLLPDYELAGAGRDDGDRQGEMCALLWRRADFVKLEEGHRWHGDDPLLPGRPDADAACVRLFSWVLLADRERPERRLLLVNTHLDHVGAVARERAAARLQAWLAARDPRVPFVLAGDFNEAAGPASASWWILTDPAAARPLRDIHHDLHPAASPAQEATFNGFRREDAPGRIDWILASPELRPAACWIDRARPEGRPPSDHYPVVARLLWPDPSSGEREEAP